MHDEESNDEDLTLNTKAVVRGFAKFVADLHENGEKKMGLTGEAIANSIVGQAHVTGADFLGENAPALFVNLAKMVIGFTIARDAGNITAAVCRQRIKTAINETAKWLDE